MMLIMLYTPYISMHKSSLNIPRRRGECILRPYSQLQVYRAELRAVQEELAKKNQQLEALESQQSAGDGVTKDGKESEKLAHMKDVAKKQQVPHTSWHSDHSGLVSLRP